MNTILSKDNVFDTIYTEDMQGESWIIGKNNPTITIRKEIISNINSNLYFSGHISYTGDGAPIEIITKDNKVISTRDAVRFIGNTSFVKSGKGGFYITNTDRDLHGKAVPHVRHQLGSVLVKEGMFSLANAEASVSGQIEVHANASLRIFQNYESNVKGETITKWGGGLADLKLRGNKTNPASLVIQNYNNKSLKQGFGKLHIENKAIVEFTGSKIVHTILYLDQLIFNDTHSTLAIKGWVSGMTHLLVKKDWGDARIAELLSRIHFDGHGPATAWEAHDLNDFGDYWEIRPYATPEPATYGAILVAAGLGLCSWQKRRWAAHKPPPQ